MPNRLIIPLLFAASVAFARSSSTQKEVTAEPAGQQHETVAEAVQSSLDVDVSDGVRFTLGVTNNTSRMLELNFESGLTHDFVVLDESGREVWRWSRGRMFTQGVRNKLVKSHSTATFSSHWNPSGKPGKYTAVALLRSANLPVEERMAFTLQ